MPKGETRLKVLILDDDADLAASLSDALSLEGHEVVVESTLDGAQAALSAGSGFEVALLDVNVIAENTIALVRELKINDPALRVVSMTGGGVVPADIGMPLATAHGADAVLLKPFTLDELLDALS